MPFCRICDEQIDNFDPRNGEPVCDRCLSKHGSNLRNSHELNGRLIWTVNDFPPIPTRAFDWSAVTDNYEPGCPIGHGETEQDAIKDLLDQLEE